MNISAKHTARFSFAAWVFALLFVILLLPVLMRHGAFAAFVSSDQRIETFLFSLRTPFLLTFFYGITLLGSATMLIPTVLVLSIVLWMRHQKHFILTLWLTLVTGEGTAIVGKSLFHRPRPDLWLQAVNETTSSFPSGHATTAVVFFGFLAYLIGRTQTNERIRTLTSTFALIFIMLIDLSRLYLGVHYPSDVLAGNLIGLTALLFSIRVTERLIAARRIRIPTLPITDVASVLGAELLVIVGTVILSPPPWI